MSRQRGREKESGRYKRREKANCERTEKNGILVSASWLSAAVLSVFLLRVLRVVDKCHRTQVHLLIRLSNVVLPCVLSSSHLPIEAQSTNLAAFWILHFARYVMLVNTACLCPFGPNLSMCLCHTLIHVCLFLPSIFTVSICLFPSVPDASLSPFHPPLLNLLLANTGLHICLCPCHPTL